VSPEGGAHGRKKWFEGTVESVKEDGKFYIVYDDGDSEDDVLECNLQLLVHLTRGTKSDVPRKKHVSEKVKVATTNKSSPSGIQVGETSKHDAPCMYAYDVKGRGFTDEDVRKKRERSSLQSSKTDSDEDEGENFFVVPLRKQVKSAQKGKTQDNMRGSHR
jgi:hypothetical protein